jgi:hypothetical protein
MSFASACQEIEAEMRAQVQVETFGHLAPVARKIYSGYMVFAFSDYGDITPLKAEFEDLPDSPWFFEDMMDYISGLDKNGLSL